MSGNINQKQQSIAIGRESGTNQQKENAIAIGTSAGYSDQQNNTIAIGTHSGYLNQGTNAIAIGTSAGKINQGANSIAILATGDVDIEIAENSIVLFNVLPFQYTFSPPKPNSFYVFDRMTTVSSTNLSYDTSTGEFTYSPSSIRFKKNIIDLQQDTSKILQVRPREFDLKSNNQHGIGYIAEELNDIDPYLANKDSSGTISGVHWNNMILYAIEEFKKIKAEFDPIIQELKKEI